MLVSQANNNPLPSLSESVSFGRFISDSSLAWEKWFTFSSHNRYVEEAERYAQPGSVAQKKAFFEAHYKRIAAQKAAAAAAAAAAKLEPTQPADYEETHVPIDHVTCKDSSVLETQFTKSVAKEEEEDVHEESSPVQILTELEVAEREASPIRDTETLNQLGEKNGNHSSTIVISDEMEQIEESPSVSVEEKPLLQHKLERNHVSSSSTSKSSAPIRASKAFSSPTRPPATITPNRRRETHNKNNVTPLIKKKSTTNETTERKRWSPKPSLHSKVFQYSSISSTPRQEPDIKIKPNTPPPARKIESSKVVPTSSAKATAASNKVFKTPTRNYWTTPSSKASSSKTAGTKHHHPSATTTPCSENLRSRTPSAPTASGSKTSGPKWHLLSSVCSKSLSACKNRLQSPTLAKPFSLRTEERATRRKQNLEEKFNSKDAEKLQIQARIKEKAETEFRKFRESFCFKARPLPDFYRDKEIIKKETTESNKVILPLSQSPKLMGTRPGCMNMKKKKNLVEEKEEAKPTISVPPPPRKMLPFSSSTKNAYAAIRKGGWGHNRQVPTASPRIICQNISPNIILH